MRAQARKNCVVVGVGNPLMGDDGIGIEVARRLSKSSLGGNVLVLERQILDVSILEQAEGASKLVVVDAVKSGRPPGSVVKFRPGGPGSTLLRVPLSHEQDLEDVIALAKKGGLRLPPIVVIGVEPEDCTIGEVLSEEVAGALPILLEEVRAEVKECAEI
ncbi:MAG TPA: hydrogenase maturation protease [Nitrososphaerales archaeon]|nr:hydrogenase maturation protease [Nitrososphaerales archaeon]